jgi:predicted glutamine amidotransferase
MCGLVGAAGYLSTKDVDVVKQLMYVDFLRGEHSIGLGAVHETSGEVRVRKATCDPIMFFQLKSVTDVFNSFNRVLMGHNRLATRGKITSANAHPYHVGSILGAHNGTLETLCLKDLEKNVEAETDSEQLIATIDALDGNIPEALSLAEGAWALSIYDTEDNTINLVRNAQRPLHYAMSESRKTLYWASEAWMLSGILARNGIKHKGVVAIDPDQLLSWGVPVNSREIFHENPTITPAEGKQRPSFQGGTGWQGYGQRGCHGNNGGNYSGRGGYSAYHWERETDAVDDGGSSGPPWENRSDADWVVYGEGYSAFVEGKKRQDNPHGWSTDTDKWELWIEGYKDAEDWEGTSRALKAIPGKKGKAEDKPRVRVKAKKEPEAKLPAPAKQEPKKEDATVIILDNKRTAADSKRSNLFDTRPGPGQKRVNRGEFRELTKHECGWCNDPVTFEDKGYFVTIPSFGPLYVCHECTTDRSIQEHLPKQEAQASA